MGAVAGGKVWGSPLHLDRLRPVAWLHAAPTASTPAAVAHVPIVLRGIWRV